MPASLRENSSVLAGDLTADPGRSGPSGNELPVANALGTARRVVQSSGAACVLLLPGWLVAVTDAFARSHSIFRFEARELAHYVFSILLSAAFWGGLLALTTHRSRAVRWIASGAFLFLGLAVMGGQLYYVERYAAYLNHRAVLFGTSVFPSVKQQFMADRGSFLRIALVPALIGVALLALRRRTRLTPERSRWAVETCCGALLVGIFFGAPMAGGEQGATPDILYFSSFGKLAEAHFNDEQEVKLLQPDTRTPVAIPPIRLTRPPRNVVFVLTESVRAREVCLDPVERCAVTPFTNRAAPHRLALHQMRSVDSTTAISLAVLWAGLSVNDSREAFHRWPLIWEYASAAGMDTAYWTSQHMLFRNSGRWLEGVPIHLHASASHLEPNASFEVGADDRKLIDRTIDDLPKLGEPFVAVVHPSNTHMPYRIDPDDAPFQPQAWRLGPGDEVDVRNRYRNAIYAQDRQIARLIDALRNSPRLANTVVVYISDHGEQIRERGAIGHTGYLTDEEVLVPFWIDAPPGVLTEQERGSLLRLRDEPLTTLDILPTLLDLLGIWESPEVTPFRTKLFGNSLLRGGSGTGRPVAMSNCTALASCVFKNWGAMQGTRKLMATQNDHAWSCFDVASDPDERMDLGEAKCADLKDVAEGNGRGRPF